MHSHHRFTDQHRIGAFSSSNSGHGHDCVKNPLAELAALRVGPIGKIEEKLDAFNNPYAPLQDADKYEFGTYVADEPCCNAVCCAMATCGLYVPMTHVKDVYLKSTPTMRRLWQMRAATALLFFSFFIGVCARGIAVGLYIWFLLLCITAAFRPAKHMYTRSVRTFIGTVSLFLVLVFTFVVIAVDPSGFSFAVTALLGVWTFVMFNLAASAENRATFPVKDPGADSDLEQGGSGGDEDEQKAQATADVPPPFVADDLAPPPAYDAGIEEFQAMKRAPTTQFREFQAMQQQTQPAAEQAAGDEQDELEQFHQFQEFLQWQKMKKQQQQQHQDQDDEEGAP